MKWKKGHLSDLSQLCCKLLSAALTPSLDDETATLRLHALTEAVLFLAPMIVRLISSLHVLDTSLHPSSPEADPRRVNYVKL